MSTLVITDFHLNSRIPNMLDAQRNCIRNIFDVQQPDEVIIMGDVFMYRKPSPSELLMFKKIIDRMKKTAKVFVIRGNHDSETKADDGVTALSLFEDENVKIITHTWKDTERKRVFIPHYENEKFIIRALEMVPKDFTVFGHFGYHGCLKSAGDADFSLSLSHFNNPTFLGHIHGFCERRDGLSATRPRVTCVGTPYTTNFGEAWKQNYYMIIKDNGEVEKCYVGDEKHLFKMGEGGPRHLVYNADRVANNLDYINDINYFTLLRIMVDSEHHPIPYDKLKVAHLDVKYAPVFNEDEVSTYAPDRNLFSINEMIIEDYVDSANSTISKEILMEGYSLLKDED
jgi:predicted phosphodiesterase